jgi:di/tricarboxylate transporter
MKAFWNRRALALIALLAICATLLLLLIPQGHSDHSAPWLALLPAFFVGLLTPFRIARPLANLNSVRISSAPCRLSRFQRPPPILLG